MRWAKGCIETSHVAKKSTCTTSKTRADMLLFNKKIGNLPNAWKPCRKREIEYSNGKPLLQAYFSEMEQHDQ